MKKRYFYVFQLYENKEGQDLSGVTRVEVIASTYAEAIKQVPEVVESNDNRKVWLYSIVAIDGGKENK